MLIDVNTALSGIPSLKYSATVDYQFSALKYSAPRIFGVWGAQWRREVWGRFNHTGQGDKGRGIGGGHGEGAKVEKEKRGNGKMEK